MERNPWYETITDSTHILQGDIIDSCPIYIPLSKKEIKKKRKKILVKEFNIIIMSQSCDLENPKVKLVIVCPVHNLSVFEKTNSFFASDKGKENLRRGNNPGYHLLDESSIEGHISEYKVVDFRNVYAVPKETLLELIEKEERIRLVSPYREHLSQAFARFFMRVGLPSDIPPFADKI